MALGREGWLKKGNLKRKKKRVISQLYRGAKNEESSNKEVAAIVIENDQSKPVSHTATSQSKLVSYTDISIEGEEDIHVDVNFEEPIDLATD